MNRKNIFRILAVFVTVFIFSNSLKTAEVSSQSSGVIVGIIMRILDWFNYHIDPDVLQNIVRKAAHFLEFCLQGICLSGCFSRSFREKAVYVLLFGLLTACTDEFLQLYFEGRGSQIQDVFLDFFGTSGGLVFSGIFEYIRRK